MVRKTEIPKWCWVYGFHVVTDASDVKHRPIMFKAPMVRAILEGRKTQTRRPVKQAIPEDADEVFFWAPGTLVATTMPRVAPSGLWVRRNDSEEGEDGWVRHMGPSPYGLIGDRLWVKETWAAVHFSAEYVDGFPTGYADDWYGSKRIPKDSQDGYWKPQYAADPCHEPCKEDRGWMWRPSIHMPRWASRLKLEIVSVRVERVEAISGEDARAEGFNSREGFLSLWRSMYGGGR